MSEFYDSNADELTDVNKTHKQWLLWRKIQDCYELCLGYSQYEMEKEEITQHLETQAKLVASLVEKVGKMEKWINNVAKESGLLWMKVKELEAALKEAEKQ